MMYKHHLAGGIFMSASKSKSKSCVVTGTIIAIALTALMCGVYALLVKNGKLTDAYSEIIISDNGCGISPKDLPHIFERFYKARNSSPSSVGIGLSLAKSIVEKTGGYITADSKLGVGSTFKLRFLNVRLR